MVHLYLIYPQAWQIEPENNIRNFITFASQICFLRRVFQLCRYNTTHNPNVLSSTVGYYPLSHGRPQQGWLAAYPCPCGVFIAPQNNGVNFLLRASLLNLFLRCFTAT